MIRYQQESAPSLLRRIKTVDGSGSGLDADLVDGTDSAALGGGATTLHGLSDVTGTAAVGSTPVMTSAGAVPVFTYTPVYSKAEVDSTFASQFAVSLKADIASPTFTGTPTAPTAAAGTNTTQIATTAYVRGEVTALVDASPATLDTLNELAAALGDDPNFATTVTNALAGKVDAAGAFAAVLARDGSGSGLDADLLRGTTPSAFGLTVLDDADAKAARATLGASGAGGYRAGNYLITPGSVTAGAHVLNRLICAPDEVGGAGTITALSIEVTTAAAGGTVRIGIYGDDNGFPGNLLLDAGTVDSSTTGVKTIALGTPLSIAAGKYWLAAVEQGAAAALRLGTSYAPGMRPRATASLSAAVMSYLQDGVAGALPSTWGEANTTTTNIRIMALMG